MKACSDFKFSMNFDIYYASQEQDKYGIEENIWSWNQTLSGYAEVLGSVDKEALKTGKFNEYEDKLIGRSKLDPRIDLNGIYHPITSILVTNIRDIQTSQHYFIEAAGDRDGLSTVYEIFAVEPYVNPWNEIEYWKILFNRSDTQALDEL